MSIIVLITGGYLVLDCRYSGCVVSTDSRFYVCISSESDTTGSTNLKIESPQFTDAPLEYTLTNRTNGRCSLLSSLESGNQFIEITLEITLALVEYLAGLRGDSLLFGRKYTLIINADNDFYSQRDTLTRMGLSPRMSNLGSLPENAHTGLPIKSVKKTGLGSSAALVTSVVAAVLSHFNVISSSINEQEKALIHNIAQYCHCLAQGKIGSGFDISSAVYGSQIYRRFDSSLLAQKLAMHEMLTIAELYSIFALDSEIMPIRSEFNFHLPPGLHLVLADVDSGSNTPKMVTAVLEWKRCAQQEGEALWENLDFLNQSIVNGFKELNSLAISSPSLYLQALELFDYSVSTFSNQITKCLAELRMNFIKIRELFRGLSKRTGVPIEPPGQTRLLDACMKVPGVLFAGVPGAGGYDAIFCIIWRQTAIEQLDQLWYEWEEVKVCPLKCTEKHAGVQIQTILG